MALVLEGVTTQTRVQATGFTSTMVTNVTTAAASTLFVVWGGRGNETVTMPPTVSGGGVVWFPLVEQPQDTGSPWAFKQGSYIWWGESTAALAAQDITITFAGGSSFAAAMSVYSFTGCQGPGASTGSSVQAVNLSGTATLSCRAGSFIIGNTAYDGGSAQTVIASCTSDAAVADPGGMFCNPCNFHLTAATTVAGNTDAGTTANAQYGQIAAVEVMELVGYRISGFSM